jgi:hypothetical protein
MTYARRILDFTCSAAALLVLLEGFWVFMARDALPNLASVRMGSLLRPPLEELSAMPPQEHGGQLSELQALRELRAQTPPDARFLTFYQRGFAYYANRVFISDLDPRLIDFYRASDKQSGLAVLRRLNIDHIYLPGWSWPTIDKSVIKRIIEDSAVSTLIVDRFGYKVYRLNSEQLRP